MSVIFINFPPILRIAELDENPERVFFNILPTGVL